VVIRFVKKGQFWVVVGSLNKGSLAWLLVWLKGDV